MLWIKALHIIAMVCWFAGLFYLPRLFVYHANTQDHASIEGFVIMERRLYYAIMMPAAFVTTLLGFWLLHFNSTYYVHAGWMQLKLLLVALLWGYHLYCGYIVKQFALNLNKKTARFYRVMNEIPTILLIGIVLLVVLKP